MTAKVPVRNPWVLPPSAQAPAPTVGAPSQAEEPGLAQGGALSGGMRAEAAPPPAAPSLATDRASRTSQKQSSGASAAPAKDPGRRPFTIYLDPPDFTLLERERQRRVMGSGRRRGYAEYSAIVSAALRAYLSNQS